MIDPFPEHIQRFILTSIDSVPHLEAILLLQNFDTEWSTSAVAERLFIPEKKAADILDDLCKAGFISRKDHAYRFDPVSPKLRETLEELNRLYPRHIVQISSLVHAKLDKQAQTFGDAFKFRKD